MNKLIFRFSLILLKSLGLLCVTIGSVYAASNSKPDSLKDVATLRLFISNKPTSVADKKTYRIADVQNKSPEDFLVRVELTSHLRQGIKAKAEGKLIISSKENNSNADLIVTIIQTGTGAKLKHSLTKDCDQILYGTKAFEKLAAGEVINYDYYLPCLFDLEKKQKYKAQVTYRLSKFNPGIKDIKSNWLAFTF